jgi:hypothetical protein
MKSEDCRHANMWKSESEVEMKWDEMLAEYFLRQVEIERKSILDYNSDVKEFINHSIEYDDINIILIYGVTNNKCMNHIYRMAIYPKTSTQSIFRDGNVIDNQGYAIRDVRYKAKIYLSHYYNII